jgi:hypothetical protein
VREGGGGGWVRWCPQPGLVKEGPETPKIFVGTPKTRRLQALVIEAPIWGPSGAGAGRTGQGLGPLVSPAGVGQGESGDTKNFRGDT